MGNKKTFLIVLVLIGLIHGAIETYFRISAKQAARYFDYDPEIVGEIFIGISVIFQNIKILFL